MSWQTHGKSAQWGKIDKVIDSWLGERQELLILLYRLLKVHPFDDEHLESDVEILQNFCQILIDYVSAGHFEIFEKIAEASEYTNNMGLNRDLLVNILRTTVIAMDFSNKYENIKDYLGLKTDLSKLGEALARRMDLEDELIQTYLEATSDLAQVTAIRKTG
jgi:regulator of sigma D